MLFAGRDFLDDALVKLGPILRVQILAILFRGQTGMTIGRNYQIPIHGTLPRFFDHHELVCSSADF
ncbi:hypothetical protein D3C71_2162030 [compost metagenome]